MMITIKKYLWFILGIIFLGIAYIGIIVPGIPWSTPSLIAAYCFVKSNKRFHDYMLNHKLFGPFIKNWTDGKVYPTKIKWIMFISMDISLIVIWIYTQNWKIVAGMAVFFAMILLWVSRYPSTKEESDRRKATGQKLSWLK